MPYFMYLRKSRRDLELEKTEGDTLARHKKILQDLAAKLGFVVDAIYEEVVSGDTIDQGIVAQTFKYSNTKIITPVKTYDPNDIYDEEYFEFGLFMSRREFATIKRRLSAGRIASVNEGKFIGSKPPYGYDKAKIADKRGYTLEPNKDADTVRNIFVWYVNGYNGESLGVTKIAHKLNEFSVPTMGGGLWVSATIRTMLSNPVYIGKIRWNYRKSERKLIDGKAHAARPRNSAPIVVDGLHKAIVPEQLFNAAQAKLADLKHPPVPKGKEMQNPLSGLIVCGRCGRKMLRRPYTNGQEPSLICSLAECDNVSAYLHIVERKIVEEVRGMLNRVMLAEDSLVRVPDAERVMLDNVDAEIKEALKQQDQMRTLLERGIYDLAVYVSRNAKIEAKLAELQESKQHIEKAILDYDVEMLRRSERIPLAQTSLDSYWDCTPAEKNTMLRSIVEQIVYTKDISERWRSKGHGKFTLDIYLRF